MKFLRTLNSSLTYFFIFFFFLKYMYMYIFSKINFVFINRTECMHYFYRKYWKWFVRGNCGMSADLICVNFIGINYLYNTFKTINSNKENIIINIKILHFARLEWVLKIFQVDTRAALWNVNEILIPGMCCLDIIQI